MAEKTITVSDHELREIRSLAESRSGVRFADGPGFPARVRAYLEARKLDGADLLRLLRSSTAELEPLLESLLDRQTSFFRYPGIFRALEEKVLPEMHMKKFWENPRSLRLWSAGCSSGQEAYSVAMIIADRLEFAETWNVHILATDISRQALDHAQRGVYSAREIEGLGPRQLERYFARVGDQFMVKPKIRNLVTFAPGNLAQVVYMGKFDCIFCVDVLPGFSEERRLALMQRFWEYLELGGYLFLGQGEAAPQAPLKFNTFVVGDAAIYQKPPAGARRAASAE